jgi:hypothetical protein
MGFELNPYDTCIANKLVDKKQCTVAWYVDNNKLSHVDLEVVTGVVDKINERFGKMTITQGKEHGNEYYLPGQRNHSNQYAGLREK